MGKKHDELMQEITLLRQEIFDLRCEIDQLRNMIPPVILISIPTDTTKTTWITQTKPCTAEDKV